jgi:hypothetical protein
MLQYYTYYLNSHEDNPEILFHFMLYLWTHLDLLNHQNQSKKLLNNLMK